MPRTNDLSNVHTLEMSAFNLMDCFGGETGMFRVVVYAFDRIII